MKKMVLFIIMSAFTSFIFSQEAKLYHPGANASKDIATAVKKGRDENKFVLIQAGGNWCKWCIEFARFAKSDPKIDSVINAAYVWYHLNWSKENENKKIFSRYEYPQRFGYPVFIILNQKGERIHTQNSEYLEDGKSSYNRNKVLSFLEMWSPRAINPKMYGN